MDKLKLIINLKKRLQNTKDTDKGFLGDLLNVNIGDLKILKDLSFHVHEIVSLSDNSYLDINIDKFIGQNVRIEIHYGDLNFYVRFNDFIKGNKLRINFTPYYIEEIDYLSLSEEKPKLISGYLENLKLISFLRNVSDYEREFDNNDIEFFFYEAEKGIKLKVNYNSEDLNFDELNSIEKLKDEFDNKHDSEERLQLFKNELISILRDNDELYSTLIAKWDLLVSNYRKSYQLYLAGFSFEKIKTSTFSYFHQFTDRIYLTINKSANYIFALPVSYILLIRYFDYNGGSIMRDFLMLLIGVSFFLLIWFVAFRNLSDSIEQIKNDISDFKSRITDVESLSEVIDKLDTMENDVMNSQAKKLDLAKGITIAVFVIMIFTFFYIYGNQIICNLKCLIKH